MWEWRQPFCNVSHVPDPSKTNVTDAFSFRSKSSDLPQRPGLSNMASLSLLSHVDVPLFNDASDDFPWSPINVPILGALGSDWLHTPMSNVGIKD
jgi:hypothetical protein